MPTAEEDLEIPNALARAKRMKANVSGEERPSLDRAATVDFVEPRWRRLVDLSFPHRPGAVHRQLQPFRDMITQEAYHESMLSCHSLVS